MKKMNDIVCLGFYERFRELCHGVKAGNARAITDAASLLSQIVPTDATLVPIPSHYGRATYTLEIANGISKIVGCHIDDCIVGEERRPLYELKKKGIATKLNFRLMHYPIGNIYLIDNCIDTGTTRLAATSLLGDIPMITISKTIAN